MIDEATVAKQESETPNGAERTSNRRVFLPAVDILESEDAIFVVADVPGVDESTVDITIEKNVLTLKGKVNFAVPEGFSLVYSEFGIGDFERVFTISNEVDREGVEATVKNGVLRLKLPKSKQALTKKVSVKAG